MIRTDGRHFDDISFDEFEAVVFGEKTGFTQPIELSYGPAVRFYTDIRMFGDFYHSVSYDSDLAELTFACG